MSLLDQVVAAISPAESDEARAEAHSHAAQYASRAPWIKMVLQHHEQIDAAMLSVKSAGGASERMAGLKKLCGLMTAHSVAEEAVLYPALAANGETADATRAYTEQAAAKMQLGLLEQLDPMSDDFEEKFHHLEEAVKHHVYQEENEWFIDLIDNAPDADHQMITQRYNEEFNRYMSGGQDNASDRAMFGSGNNTVRSEDGMITGDQSGQRSTEFQS